MKRIMGRAAAAGDSKRQDDNEESAKKRFNTYKQQTMPIVELYEKENKVRKINAERGIDEIYADVKAAFDAAHCNSPYLRTFRTVQPMLTERGGE